MSSHQVDERGLAQEQTKRVLTIQAGARGRFARERAAMMLASIKMIQAVARGNSARALSAKARAALLVTGAMRKQRRKPNINQKARYMDYPKGPRFPPARPQTRMDVYVASEFAAVTDRIVLVADTTHMGGSPPTKLLLRVAAGASWDAAVSAKFKTSEQRATRPASATTVTTTTMIPGHRMGGRRAAPALGSRIAPQRAACALSRPSSAPQLASRITLHSPPSLLSPLTTTDPAHFGESILASSSPPLSPPPLSPPQLPSPVRMTRPTSASPPMLPRRSPLVQGASRPASSYSPSKSVLSSPPSWSAAPPHEDVPRRLAHDLASQGQGGPRSSPQFASPLYSPPRAWPWTLADVTAMAA